MSEPTHDLLVPEGYTKGPDVEVFTCDSCGAEWRSKAARDMCCRD